MDLFVFNLRTLGKQVALTPHEVRYNDISLFAYAEIGLMLMVMMKYGERKIFFVR